MLSPIIPETSEKIFVQLGSDIKTLESLNSFDGMISGNKTGKAEVLYARLDEKEAAEESIVSPEIEEITIDDFQKTDLRVALVTDCDKVAKSDKLLKLQLDLGYEQRQVVAGIAKFYEPKDIIGKKVIIVSNLAPVTIRGIQSSGMILASGEEDVKVIFADNSAEIGSRVR
jgi:methionyl-tRNA synthetase